LSSLQGPGPGIDPDPDVTFENSSGQNTTEADEIIERSYDIVIGEIDHGAGGKLIRRPKAFRKPSVDLRQYASRLEDGREIGNPTDVAQGLQDQAGRLAPTRRAAWTGGARREAGISLSGIDSSAEPISCSQILEVKFWALSSGH
jgi:hypothetical protein